MLVLDDEAKTIDSTRTESLLISYLEQAYYVLNFIRMTKPLGTAILKSIYQTMLVGIKLAGNYDKSLDLAFASNIIPQLENLRSSTLETMVNFFFYDIVTFFRKIHEGNEREQYRDDFRNFLAFISVNKPEKKLEDFLSQKVSEDVWNSINSAMTEKKRQVVSSLFKHSLEDLMRTTVI